MFDGRLAISGFFGIVSEFYEIILEFFGAARTHHNILEFHEILLKF